MKKMMVDLSHFCPRGMRVELSNFGKVDLVRSFPNLFDGVAHAYRSLTGNKVDKTFWDRVTILEYDSTRKFILITVSPAA